MPIWLDVLLAAVFVVLAWEFISYTGRAARKPPGLLATSPALLGRRANRLATIGGLAFLVLLAGATTCFGRASVHTDALQPDYTYGDIAFYVHGPAFQPEALQPGDVIVYHRADGRLGIRRIAGIDGEQITLRVPATESSQGPSPIVPRKAISGKVVGKLDPGEEIKNLMRRIDSRNKEKTESPAE